MPNNAELPTSVKKFKKSLSKAIEEKDWQTLLSWLQSAWGLIEDYKSLLSEELIALIQLGHLKSCIEALNSTNAETKIIQDVQIILGKDEQPEGLSVEVLAYCYRALVNVLKIMGFNVQETEVSPHMAYRRLTIKATYGLEEVLTKAFRNTLGLNFNINVAQEAKKSVSILNGLKDCLLELKIRLTTEILSETGYYLSVKVENAINFAALLETLTVFGIDFQLPTEGQNNLRIPFSDALEKLCCAQEFSRFISVFKESFEHQVANATAANLYQAGGEADLANDFKRAYILYKLAISKEQGHLGARCNLAMLIIENRVDSKAGEDGKYAISLLIEGAERGHMRSAYRLAILYQQGNKIHGVAVDLVKALEYFTKAWELIPGNVKNTSELAKKIENEIFKIRQSPFFAVPKVVAPLPQVRQQQQQQAQPVLEKTSLMPARQTTSIQAQQAKPERVLPQVVRQAASIAVTHGAAAGVVNDDEVVGASGQQHSNITDLALALRVYSGTFPESYEKIWQLGSGDFLKSAQLLLRDYTKDNSAVIRLFTGHWNRHHIAEITSILADQNLSNENALVERLLELRPSLKNQHGSLAARIEFIFDKYRKTESDLRSNIRARRPCAYSN
ncbi:MAG: hypothetical protein K0S08_297 [Gammaproteobacteria bacterium]|jgi:hypothetical protein|nr:hypothetical protein [Gammaproteobacteria bacterium]